MSSTAEHIYPKLAAWDQALEKVIKAMTPGRLCTAVDCVREKFRREFAQGIFWLNPAHVNLHYGNQAISFCSSVRNGLERASAPFCSVSETTHWPLLSWTRWKSREERQRYGMVIRPSADEFVADLELRIRRILGESDLTAKHKELMAPIWLARFLTNSIHDGHYYICSDDEEIRFMISTPRATYYGIINPYALNERL